MTSKFNSRIDKLENKIPEPPPIVKVWLGKGNNVFTAQYCDEERTRKEIMKKYSGDEYHHIFIIPIASEKEKSHENKQR